MHLPTFRTWKRDALEALHDYSHLQSIKGKLIRQQSKRVIRLVECVESLEAVRGTVTHVNMISSPTGR